MPYILSALAAAAVWSAIYSIVDQPIPVITAFACLAVAIATYKIAEL